MERLMGALDDFSGAIITANPFDQLVVRLAGAFGNENVTGAPEITRRLSQRPAREEMFVPEWRLAIDEDDVEPVFEVEILESVIEQKGVGLQFPNREQAALDPV